MFLILAQEDGNALLRAAQWIESLVQGPLVVSIAILAIAVTGFSMLSGRIAARRSLTMVFGCFVVFGWEQVADYALDWAAEHVRSSSVTPIARANAA